MIVFTVGDREHALPADSIVEVLRMVAITPVPEAPPWLAGVINLRGGVIPAIDLRARLGLPAVEPGLNTPIVVVDVDGRRAGLITDSVTEILTLPLDAIDPPDALTGSSTLVSALARAGDRVLIILDLHGVCSGAEELAPVEQEAQP